MIGNLSKSESAFVPAMPLKTIEGLAAWRGVDFRNRDDFTCQLSDVDITEIETAIQAVIQGGSHILRLIGTTFTSRGSEIGFFECEMGCCYGVEGSLLFAAFRLRAIPWSRPQPPSSV
jgi:hypothetical protein